jgi:hypothetical protein
LVEGGQGGDSLSARRAARQTMSPGETALWQALREAHNRRRGPKWRRFVPVKGTLVTFWCPSLSRAVFVLPPGLVADESRRIKIRGIEVVQVPEGTAARSSHWLVERVNAHRVEL